MAPSPALGPGGLHPSCFLTKLTNHLAHGSVVVVNTLNLYEAKTRLSSLVDAAAAGEEIVIAKAGRPMAKLVPIKSAVRRRPGRGKGKVTVRADFDAPLPAAVLQSFAGPVE